MAVSAWLKMNPETLEVTDGGEGIAMPVGSLEGVELAFNIRNEGAYSAWLVPQAAVTGFAANDWLDEIPAGQTVTLGPFDATTRRNWCLAHVEAEEVTFDCVVALHYRRR